MQLCALFDNNEQTIAVNGHKISPLEVRNTGYICVAGLLTEFRRTVKLRHQMVQFT